MFRSLRIFFLMLLIGVASCNDNVTTMSGPSPGGNNNNPTWLVPTNQVFDGGVGKDGIPALVNPALISAAEATYLEDGDLVVGYRSGTDARAYPHKILDWHEIINDDVNEKSIAITYCPLTGTAIGWSRLIDGNNTTFGVSGFLYNTNLIPYDRATDSNWSQMRLECINGQLIGDQITSYQVIETTWGTWKTLYPNTLVVSTDTGWGRPYGLYPYIDNSGADYRFDPYLLFPIEIDDGRLPRKERVHGVIISGNAKVYPLSRFGNKVTIIEDTFQNTDLVIVGHQSMNFINSFQRTLSDGTVLEFEAASQELPAIFGDHEGNQWNIFGEAISGPRLGQKLLPTNSFIGYWFSWGAFYPNATIYSL